MIVYSGKQFGNNFNNGDEGVFQDANRPRDRDMFKLRPGLQSDKWDLRGTNKNIYTKAAQLAVKGMTKAGAFSSLPSDYAIPRFQETYTVSDLSSFSGYRTAGNVTWGADDLEYYADFLKGLKKGEPGCILNKDGNVEIVESGTYIVQAFAQFVFPYGYNTTDSYKYQERIGLLGWENNAWKSIDKSQSRACGTSDIITTWQVSWLNKGEIYNVGAAHSYSSATVMFEILNIIRLA